MQAPADPPDERGEGMGHCHGAEKRDAGPGKFRASKPSELVKGLAHMQACVNHGLSCQGQL